MNPHKRIAVLVLIMCVIVIVAETITISILYNTALEEEKMRLIVSARSQARLIEAISRFDQQHSKDYPGGAQKATLDTIRDAHSRYRALSRTGEFTLSKREGDQIVFVLNHRHYDLNNPRPVPWMSDLAEPMRQALSGKSGTIVALDYRGEKVLAAHEPVRELNLGIVAKIDLSEVRSPFISAGILSGIFTIVIIVLGAFAFIRITDPIIRRLQDTVQNLEKVLSEVKTLRGIVPICSFCKKIRDDKGYWDQVEVYVSQHTNANFSHSICPDCAAKHYPQLKAHSSSTKK